MATTMLLDMGASRIKAALYDTRARTLIATESRPSPAPRLGPHGEVELAPREYVESFQALWSSMQCTARQVESVWLCAEMHGALYANEAGEPLTGYISWRDARAMQAAGGAPFFDQLAGEFGPAFFEQTGMRLKPGLPATVLSYLARTGTLAGVVRPRTLPDWLLHSLGEPAPRMHPTLAAATGWYSLREAGWSARIVQACVASSIDLKLPPLCGRDNYLGSARLDGQDIPFFGGIGDLQAALTGAGLGSRHPMIANLGTGSQVAKIIEPGESPNGIELRPLPDGRIAAALTHIPAGRALTTFAGLIDGIAGLGGGKEVFWPTFASLTADEVLASPFEVEMGVFAGNWKAGNGGAVRSIWEHNTSARGLIASVAKGWLAQYAEAFGRLDPQHLCATVGLAGGLPRRGDFIATTLAVLSPYNYQPSEPLVEEETMDGLLALIPY
jgi:sugar (pentulose or hexulose) kinase